MKANSNTLLPFVTALFSGLVLANLGALQVLAQEEADSLVTIEAGDLPIILSAPHGGGMRIPGVPEREGKGVKFFRSTSDVGTGLLTEKLADALEKRFGKRPYVVIARFHRRYLDANRPPELAYESEHAKATYDDYHQALSAARSEVVERWGRGIVFDIHGQGTALNTIFRGTQNGKTATHLVNRFGREALTGETSVFGLLAKQGIRVIPETDSTDRESPAYNGGYIVRTYGSSAGGTFDAIQLELGRDLRSPKADTANGLADAITSFAKRYLPDAESDSQDVRVGVYRDVGAGKSVENLMRVLRQFDGVSVRELKADDIRSGALTDLDVLIQPGGSGGGQGRHLREEGRNKIREFIGDGGGFIGICAGAYLASADYEWSLNVLDAKVLDRKHWARGKGRVDIGLTDVGRRILKSEEEQLNIYYGQGPLLAPAGNEDIEDYEIIATYRTEIAKNGAPEGIMKGTTAIAKGRFGRGQVLCFSPHPELTEGLEALILYAIDHVNQVGRNQRDGSPVGHPRTQE